MSILSAIPLIGDLFTGAKDLISEAIVDKDKQLSAINKLKVLELNITSRALDRQHEENVEQIEVAKLNAKSNDSYVRRARPTILWICAVGLGYNWLVYPMLLWLLKIIPVWYPEFSDITPPPSLAIGEMMPILLGMLGLSGLRSFDKSKGSASK